jgi:hypothetical protein
LRVIWEPKPLGDCGCWCFCVPSNIAPSNWIAPHVSLRPLSSVRARLALRMFGCGRLGEKWPLFWRSSWRNRKPHFPGTGWFSDVRLKTQGMQETRKSQKSIILGI